MQTKARTSNLGKSQAEKPSNQPNSADRSGTSKDLLRTAPPQVPLVVVFNDGKSIGPVDAALVKKVLGTTDDF